MADPVSWLVIERGWSIVDRDGNEIGRVDELVGDTGKDIFSGIAVSEGLFKGRRFIPSERVSEIVEGRVTVDLTGREAEQLEEYQPPGTQAEILPPDRS